MCRERDLCAENLSVLKQWFHIFLVLFSCYKLACQFMLQTRQQGSSFLTELKQKLLLSPTDAARAGTRYNVPLINSLVLYVGMQVHHSMFQLLIKQLKTNKSGNYAVSLVCGISFLPYMFVFLCFWFWNQIIGKFCLGYSAAASKSSLSFTIHG